MSEHRIYADNRSSPDSTRTPKQRLLTVADNIEKYWAPLAVYAGVDEDETIALALDDAKCLREIAETLP